MLDIHKQAWTANINYYFAVFHQEEKCLIGEVCLMEVSRKGIHNCEIGYTIFNTFQRRGFGKEAVTGLIKIAFDYLILQKIEANVSIHNPASVKLSKSVGLKVEGMIDKDGVQKYIKLNTQSL